MRRLTIFLFAVALAVPAVAVAQSDSSTLFKGQSSQKRPVTARITGVNVNYIRVRWTAVCPNAGVYGGVTLWRGPRLDSNGRFRSASAYDDANLSKFDGRIAARIAGRRVGDKLFGTFTATLKLTRKGKPVSTCRSGNVKWTARATEVVGTAG